jgi:hypothetical protein
MQASGEGALIELLRSVCHAAEPIPVQLRAHATFAAQTIQLHSRWDSLQSAYVGWTFGVET